MNNPPLVSIIMAAYNSEKTIKESIDSVIGQTFQDWELIVVNDCSTDKTEKIVDSYSNNDSRIIVVNNEKNSGVSVSRKNGMSVANGEWIAILDSDDVWKPEKLDKQIKCSNDTSADLIYTASGFMDNDGKTFEWELHVPKCITYKDLLKQNLISNSSVMVKKDLYEKYYAIGDEMHEDFAVWLGMLRDGIRAYGIDESLLIYRLSRNSKTSNKLKSAKMNWNTYRYVGLGFFASLYYMCIYTLRGFKKYSHLKSGKETEG